MEFYADRRQISLLVFLLVLLLCQVKNVIMPDADRRQMQVVTVKVWQSRSKFGNLASSSMAIHPALIVQDPALIVQYPAPTSHRRAL